MTGQLGRYYGKLLFGTAFRAPPYREYLSNTSYNFSLKPERLTTLEAQAGLALSHADRRHIPADAGVFGFPAR